MFNFDWISGLDLGIAKLLFVCAFIAPLVFSMFLKKEYIFKGATNKKTWRNLKIWITALTIFMVCVYLYF